MKVPVVIPCYNERETIEAIVRAVRSSAIADLEIIVVDDCSTDGTREIIEDRLREVADVIICHAANRGKGAAGDMEQPRPAEDLARPGVHCVWQNATKGLATNIQQACG